MCLYFDVSSEHSTLFIDNLFFYLTHGHKNIPMLNKGDVILSGHTHIPLYNFDENGVHHFNPGSISIAKGGFENSYMIYQNRKFTVIDFNDNIIIEKLI